jgi:hypothetical protein
MALRVHVGGRESDSLVSLADADVCIKATYPEDSDSWLDLASESREHMLRLGAQLLGMLPLRGRTIYCGQALCFPRSSQHNPKIIPDEAKQAQCELSYSVIYRAIVSAPTMEEGEISGSRVSSVSLGGLLAVSFAGSAVTSGTLLDKIVRSVQFPTYLGLKKYLSQMRGGSVSATTDAGYPTCSTTTTTTTSTVTTTST